MTKETPKSPAIKTPPASSAREDGKPVKKERINVRVQRHVNNVRAGDVLLVDDTPAARSLIRGGYYALVTDTSED